MLVNHTGAVFCRPSLAGWLVAIGVSAPFAFAAKVEIQFDHATDFSRIHRYKWRTHPVFEKSPELPEIYATGIQLVLQAGNAQLMKQGFEPDDVSPDVYVTFYILTKGAKKLPTGDSGWYSAPTWTVTEVEPKITGMLVIDIVDAASSKLLWRAYCGEKIKDMNKRDKKITSLVNKALEQFPPN